MSLAEQLHGQVTGLRRYALVLTRNRDDAEDLVQDTLTKAIANAHTWQPDSDLRPWLFRILHNTHMSNMRKLKVRQMAAVDLPDPVMPETQTGHVELKQVLQALDRIPEAQRAPIVLVALEDMSYADAARSLGVPLGTFMSRLGRGRAALRSLVGDLKRGTLAKSA
jgi:RNA polymerase sigma-70 factor (ECF subfamily)